MPTPINIDEFEKNEVTKNRPLAKNTKYNWCNWLITHIPESVKRPAIIFKEKIKIFETKLESNTINTSMTKDHYKPEKIGGAFDDKYIKYKCNGRKKSSIELYHEKARPYLSNTMDDFRITGIQKIHITMRISFMS